jgi:phosphoribosylaminoimidazole synthetase
MYPGGKYDLAGFAVGAVERDQVLPRPVSVGDVLIGLPSSGIHSNGYSLVRHLVEKNNFSYHEAAPFDSTRKLGEALLTPTQLYVKSCMPLIRKGLVKAMAHITGGGITENLPRVLGDDVSADIDLNSYVLPDVFQWMSKLGNIKQEELIRTFNCGVGMILVVSADKEQEILSLLAGEKPISLGKLIARGTEIVQYKNTWKSK